MESEHMLKTGTTTVGVVGKDCIILAADKRATAGNLIVDKKVEKIVKITDEMALTTAGVVSDIQLLVKLIRAELKLKRLRTDRQIIVKEAANLTAGYVYSSIRRLSMFPSLVHFLFGGSDRLGLHLYDIYPDGSITEIDGFVSSGSGSVFALGVLETLYKEGLREEQASELAIKAVKAALQRDSASGEGIDLMLINKDGVKKLQTKKIQQHLQ